MSVETFVRDLGIDLPIVSAGMAMIAGPELVAAVSEAGGLGILGTGPLPPPLLSEEIHAVRAATSRPFGVNLIVEDTGFGPTCTEAHVEVCRHERVPVVVFFWRFPPLDWLTTLRSAGTRIWLTVNTVAEAQQAADIGVDALVVQSAEAGGHVRATLGLMTLLPAVRDAVENLPLVAAGGIADGRTAAAALALGADAVCLGTRFVASAESLAHDRYKAAIVAASAEHTTITRVFGPEWPDAPMRALRNRAVFDSDQGLPPHDAAIGRTRVFSREYTMPDCSAVLPNRSTEGDFERMCLASGTSAGLVASVLPAAEIVRTVARDALERLKRQASALERVRAGARD